MNKRKKFGYYLIVLILGSVVGSVLGDALALVLPPGVVRKFFLNSVGFSVGPGPINLNVINLTFGFGLNINVVGVLGIFLVAYFLRWME